jgi:hypothetical protein
MSDFIDCFGCGAKSLDIEGECHKYMLSSPGCWEMYTEAMEREYSDLRYWKAHQFTVDSYACQHVGKKEDKRAVNSVNIHLAALYGIFEKGLSLDQAPKLRSQFSQFYKGTDLLEWLEPPQSFGELTIYEIWNNEDVNLHFDLAKQWAKSVWEAWAHQHGQIIWLVNPTI